MGVYARPYNVTLICIYNQCMLNNMLYEKSSWRSNVVQGLLLVRLDYLVLTYSCDTWKMNFSLLLQVLLVLKNSSIDETKYIECILASLIVGEVVPHLSFHYRRLYDIVKGR